MPLSLLFCHQAVLMAALAVQQAAEDAETGARRAHAYASTVLCVLS
jgi:hypothetical protein